MHRSSRRPRLLLVNPRRRHRFYWDLREVAATVGKKVAAHPLALPLLAALTPRHWQVGIVDEEIQRLDFRATPDLVGITALISNVTRAYEIADHFRARGVPVVMGGPEVSSEPEVALRHADTVVAGEAEAVWETCLADFQAGKMRSLYRADGWTDFKRSPRPRWELVETQHILSFPVQVSRGCPRRCDFCLVRGLFGPQHRYREVDDVIAEIAALPGKQVNFADDNLTADKEYARELMRRLTPLKISWSCQASIDTAFDTELLRLMARAGCESILIGFESLDKAALKEARKLSNPVARYPEAVANLHAAGIHPIASFIVGFEADTLESFDRIYEFCEENLLTMVMLSALTAMPGTDLYRRMQQERRVTTFEKELVTGLYPNLHYKNFTQVELFNKGTETLRRLYSYRTLRRKAPKVLGNGAFREDRDPGLGLWTKARTAATLARSHLLSRDPHKRGLFTDLFALVKDRQLAPGAVVPYLMFMESFNGYLEVSGRQNKRILARLRQNDRLR